MDQKRGDSIFTQLQEMKQRMDRLFDETLRSGYPEPDTTGTTEQCKPWIPLMDIWESEEVWVLIMDLPGVAFEDLQVELEDNRLTVKGMRKSRHGREGMKAAQIERIQGAFSRTFTLPGKIREETIKAELRQGELTVLITKEPGLQAAQKRVQVRAG